MSIQRIDINAALWQANNAASQTPTRLATDMINKVSTTRRAAGTDRTGVDSGFINHQSNNDELNRTAASIRTADSSMLQIRDYLAEIKDELTTFVKNYPPFPPGSEERVQALKNFAGFRKEIDQLTVPPADDGTKAILADPKEVPGAGGMEITVGNNKFIIRGQEAHTGPSGLNIPALPDSASDQDITAIIQKLDTAEQTLGTRRAELAQDAVSLAAGLSRHQDVLKAGMNEASAALKSREIRDIMVTLSSDRLTLNAQTVAGLV